MPRHCPDCKVDMIPRSFFGVLVDTCPECGSVFFDEGEVSQIKARGGERAFAELDEIVQPTEGHIPREENHYRKCPACAASMHRYRYMYTSPIFLDSCESCGGVFIENGELKQMKDYLDSCKVRPVTAATQERDLLAASMDAMTIAQNEKANRAHRLVRAMAFYPWQ